MSKPLLNTVSLRIEAGRKLLCDGLHLEVFPGEFWCVIGRNGAGKSTLLHTLAGLVAPRKGHIFLEGRDVRSVPTEALAHLRGLLAQQQFDAFSSTVIETVIAGRHPYQLGLGWENDEDRAVALSALRAVGMAETVDKDVMKLSGGERQRVALATLLAQNPDLLLLDEPTAHQDAAAQLAVMGLVHDIVVRSASPSTRGKAAIAACHDINLVSRFATHVLVMAGERHWQGRAESVLTPGVLREAFGCPFHVAETELGKLFIPMSA